MKSVRACRLRGGFSSFAVEERQGGRGEQRRAKDVVVGQARQDRERVTTLRPALVHPPAVAEAAVEQVEDLDVVAWRRHVSIGGEDKRPHPPPPTTLAD